MNEMTNIKDWYLETFPEDELGQTLLSNVTFLDLFEAMDSYKDVYETLFGDAMGGDSLIRERIFQALADVMEVPYQEVYDQWMMSVESTKRNKKQMYAENMDYEGRIEDERNTSIDFVESLLESLYEKSALTFEGLAVESIPEVLNFFIEEEGQEDAFANIFSGEQFNEVFELTGRNKYPEDLTIVVFENTGAVLAVSMGARWLDDVVDNNAEREGHHPFSPMFEESPYNDEETERMDEEGYTGELNVGDVVRIIQDRPPYDSYGLTGTIVNMEEDFGSMYYLVLFREENEEPYESWFLAEDLALVKFRESYEEAKTFLQKEDLIYPLERKMDEIFDEWGFPNPSLPFIKRALRECKKELAKEGYMPVMEKGETIYKGLTASQEEDVDDIVRDVLNDLVTPVVKSKGKPTPTKFAKGGGGGFPGTAKKTQ